MFHDFCCAIHPSSTRNPPVRGTMENGELRIENGEMRMENAKWRVEVRGWLGLGGGGIFVVAGVGGGEAEMSDTSVDIALDLCALLASQF